MPETPQLPNPYAGDADPVEVRAGRGAACAAIALFLMVLVLPPLYRNVFEAARGDDAAWVPAAEIFDKPGGQPLLEHLREFEGELEDGAQFTGPPRRLVQGVLTRALREGNRKTYIGRDGWLFLRPALGALTGYGPLEPEPDSVAKDPNRTPWRAPLGAIETFAAQLEDAGVELVLVPIPVKPMIYPENVGAWAGDPPAPLRHRDTARFYAAVEALPNVRVIDLADEFAAAKREMQVFLKQDTHWTPEAMQLAAQAVARALPEAARGPGGVRAADPVEVANIGDLVEQLELPGDAGFEPERAVITPVDGFERDPTSPVTLLGDSFTNIFSSATLGWGEGAGFAQHLALALGRGRLDVIARNGQASTGVRRELAARGREHLERKQVVVWAIAARDLFLSETAARENNVLWEDVEVTDIADPHPPSQGGASPGGAPGGAADDLVVRGKLAIKSAIKDPNSVTYKNAIFVSEYEVVEVLEGSYDEPTFITKEWAFRDKQLTPASRREVGDVVDLRLRPFEPVEEQEFDDLDATKLFTIPVFWAEAAGRTEGARSAEANAGAGAGAGSTQAPSSHARRAHALATAACLLAALAIAALAVWLARRGPGRAGASPASA